MSKFSVEEITYGKYSKICRCCIINEGEMDVFEAHVEDLPLSAIIYTCTNEMIAKSDGLPRSVCNACAQVLINYYFFIEKFKEAQTNIKYMYRVFENKNGSEKISNSSDQLDPNINGTTLFEEKNREKEKLPEELNFVDMKKSNSLQVSEGAFIEDNSQSSRDIGLENIFLDQDTSDKDDTSRKKKFHNQSRIEVDPRLRSDLDLQCFQCLVVFSSRMEMEKHYESTGHTMAPNYKCGICSKAINKRKAYWDHMAMHRHLKKKSVCEICGAVVVSIHLKRHKLVHLEKSHVCQYCGKGYVQKNTLTDHVNRKHKGEKMDMKTLCFLCGKLCNDLKGLTSHLNTHSDEKWKKLPHHCEECGKHFLNAQSLNTHKYMAHKIKERVPKQRKKFQGYKQYISGSNKSSGNTKESKSNRGRDSVEKTGIKREPRECPVCHKMICFLGYGRHLTTHTDIKPHQCKYCPKSFRLFSSLKSHMYVHLNLKPFECDVCGQKFRHYTTLKVHKRVHTGEKPYVCSACAKGFRSASGLKRHQNQRKHHMPILNIEE